MTLDSVFQIAAHETHFGLDRLYALCEIARELLMPYNIGRVIARPFVGETPETFERTGNRRDYAIEPPTPTVLQKLHDDGGKVLGVGTDAMMLSLVGPPARIDDFEDLLQGYGIIEFQRTGRVALASLDEPGD